MNAASWLDALPAGDRWRARLLRDGPRIATWILVIALAVQAALFLTDLAAAGPTGARAGVRHAALPSENPAIERMRRMISEQPGLLADVLRPQAVLDPASHRMNGFRVYPGRNRAAFMRLGLRPGDQVTAINGTPLDDRERGEQILRTLGSSSEARVTLIRGGQQQDLTLNIAQVAQEAEGLAAAPPPPAGAIGAVPPAADQPPMPMPPMPPPAEGPGGDSSQ